MAKIVCVLCDDPIDGYPTGYHSDDLLKIERRPNGQALRSPPEIGVGDASCGAGDATGSPDTAKFSETLA